MLTWREGDRKLGCTYHKKAPFKRAGLCGQVDVFVMPRLSAKRPIAVTANVTPTHKGKVTVEDKIDRVVTAPSLEVSLPPRLAKAGLSESFAESVTEDVIALVNQDAATIEAAMSDFPF